MKYFDINIFLIFRYFQIVLTNFIAARYYANTLVGALQKKYFFETFELPALAIYPTLTEWPMCWYWLPLLKRTELILKIPQLGSLPSVIMTTS